MEMAKSKLLQRKNRAGESGVFGLTMRDMAKLLFFSVFFVPDYYGFELGIAFNVQRIVLIVIWVLILSSQRRREQMARVIVKNKRNPYILLYLFVCFYTAVYRLDIGTFFSPLFDQIVVFYTTIYMLRNEYTTEDLLDQIIRLGYILCILGLVEEALRRPLFGHFEMIKGMFAGSLVRDGIYRIAGPAHHPLGYGLYLQILLALACYDYRRNRIDLFCRLPLLFLTALNIFFTGSRSTLGISMFELLLLTLFSEKSTRKLVLRAAGLCLLIVIPLLVLFYRTDFVQALMIRLMNMVDGAFHTKLSLKLFGYYSQHLEDSSRYRELLPEIFKLDWLNPFVGRGNSYVFSMYYEGFLIESIDNFYIHQYIKIAYPGLFTTVLLIVANFLSNVRMMLQSRNALYRVLFIIFLIYFLTLFFVDALGTLDYIFVLFGVLYVEEERQTRQLKN